MKGRERNIEDFKDQVDHWLQKRSITLIELYPVFFARHKLRAKEEMVKNDWQICLSSCQLLSNDTIQTTNTEWKLTFKIGIQKRINKYIIYFIAGPLASYYGSCTHLVVHRTLGYQLSNCTNIWRMGSVWRGLRNAHVTCTRSWWVVGEGILTSDNLSKISSKIFQ